MRVPSFTKGRYKLSWLRRVRGTQIMFLDTLGLLRGVQQLI
jgi:hypothetical protein